MIAAVVKEAIALKAMTKYSFPPHTVKYSGQFVTLLYKTKSKIPNNENCITVTMICIIRIKVDRSKRSLVIYLVKPKRIKDPIPYPKTVVSVKRAISPPLFK